MSRITPQLSQGILNLLGTRLLTYRPLDLFLGLANTSGSAVHPAYAPQAHENSSGLLRGLILTHIPGGIGSVKDIYIFLMFLYSAKNQPVPHIQDLVEKYTFKKKNSICRVGPFQDKCWNISFRYPMPFWEPQGQES